MLVPVFAIFIKESAALEVFKWTDRQGITHYSSEPPPGLASIAEILNITPSARSRADQSQGSVNYVKWLDMAKALEASRLSRERLRLEKAKLRLQTAEQATVPQDTAPAVEYRTLIYPRIHHRYRRYYVKPRPQGHGHYAPEQTHAPAPKYIRAYKGYRAQCGL